VGSFWTWPISWRKLMPEPPVVAVRDAQSCEGILFIGDPHIAAAPPGFRLDDYPQTVLGKAGLLPAAC
jgi:hypothetical protein